MNEKTQPARVVSTFRNLSKAERQMAGGKVTEKANAAVEHTVLWLCHGEFS